MLAARAASLTAQLPAFKRRTRAVDRVQLGAERDVAYELGAQGAQLARV